MANSQFDTLKARYEKGTIAEPMLKKYVMVGRLTAEEYEAITGEKYE